MLELQPTRKILWTTLLTIALSFCLAASSSTGVNADYQGNVSSTACSDNMISYWKLDETEGTIFEDHVGSNDGVCTGDKCPLPEEGNVNGGQRFLGSQEIYVPSSTDFNWDGSSEFSIELWVNIPAEETSEDVRVFIGRHAGTPAWWVGHYPGSYTAVFGIRDSKGVGSEISGGLALNDGEWHHVVAEHDGNNDVIKLYVDGELAASADIAFLGNWFSDQVLSIGFHNPPPYYHFTGSLDEIAVYGKALSLDEIRYHYEKGLENKGYCEPVSLEIIVDGNGSVEKSPSDPYQFGQMVTLTANPEPDMIFYAWSGDLTEFENPVTVTMDQDKSITATFKDPGIDPVWYTLTVSSIGQGSVALEPDQELYLHGSNVTITAVAEPGWVFSDWSGDLSGNQNPAEIM
ncbi:MAG: LamG domain-containing protein, partial [Anaerolineales bacterium]|nr:LamG domain-containing protein [Anaerolineales bacterium]